MNSEEPALDLCNAKNSAGESAASTPADEIIPRNSGLRMDGDAVKQGVDAPTLARLTACPDGDIEPQRTKEKSDSDEVNGNKNNGITVTAAAVGSDLGDTSDDNNHQNSSGMVPEAPVPSFSFGDGVDEGDMDIGVDLSLDETGVLESEPPVPKSESASSGAGVNSISRPGTAPPEKPTELGHGDMGPLSPSPTENFCSPASDQEDLQIHKPGAKRVTFPSDEDIVSGAVEPKDPWRHGNKLLHLPLSFSLLLTYTQMQEHTHTC